MTNQGRGRDMVAILLAAGVAIGLAALSIAACYAVVARSLVLSENATQVLTGVFGGVIGILGTYVGVRAGDDAATRRTEIEHRDLEQLAVRQNDDAGPVEH